MNRVIRAVLVGKIMPLGRRGVDSGIFKQPVDKALEVTRWGLRGDQQGDRKHHGGPDKALHHYPFDHYAVWRAELPERAELFKLAGAFGENLSTETMTEADVCLGDVYQLGSARVQVSQGRQPCWRLNLRFDQASMARQVQTSGRTGWYYRVLDEGRVAAGDSLRLVDRPAEDWTIKRVLDLLYRDSLNYDGLAQLAALTLLPPSWLELVRARLAFRRVEDWSRRLTTPPEAPPTP